MNKDAIFGFIKKNLLSLGCAIVAIAAAVLLFYPIGGMVSDLKTEADSHAGKFQSLTAMLTKSRKLPISDVSKPDTGALTAFPNNATIAAGTAANEKWVAYSNQMVKDLQELNRKGHELLIPDELPNPKYETTLFRFSQLYKLVLSNDPAATSIGDPTATPPIAPDQTLNSHGALNLQNDILHGALPPTPKEISDGTAALWNSVYAQQVYYQNGKPLNLPEVTANFSNDAAGLPQRMKAAVAKTHKMYVEKDAFTISPAITLDVKPQLLDVWFAQLSFWMQQDLAIAIAEANADSTSILTSPVKRLISIQVPIPPAQIYIMPPPAAGGTGGPADQPSASKETDALTSNFSVSPTGRYSNGMYDVTKFKMVVDVDANKVNQFLETLSHDRLITVYLENEYALNSETEAAKGYLYGPSATMRLQIEGEILFMRSWTKDLMPDRVKMTMGLLAAPAGGPGTPAVPVGSGNPYGGGGPVGPGGLTGPRSLGGGGGGGGQ